MSGLIADVAAQVGASEGGLRLMISLLAGFPLSLLYRQLVFGTSSTYQHIYFILTGIGILWFNFGVLCLFNLVSILFIYIMLLITGPSRTSVILAIVCNMSYLMTGYILLSTEHYDINWTTPQCVLCLRLIGLVFDIYDGQKKESDQSGDQKAASLAEVPSLLEVASYCLFYGGCLIGPQFSMRRYRQFVTGHYCTDPDNKLTLPLSGSTSVRYLVTGVMYIAAHLLISPAFPSKYLVTHSFSQIPFYSKCITLAFWCRGELYKYIGCWLIAESSCSLCGLSYNGLEPGTGQPRWDGCCNVKLVRFETCLTFQHIIDSFNLNTNRWMASYVYKRLRFLGNKLYSQIVTLVFLALWHGFATGYYACFFMEFITMKWDKEFVPILSSSPHLVRLYSGSPPVLRGLVSVVRWAFLQVMMAFCLTPFVQLTAWKWWKVWGSMNYCGLIVFCSWPLLAPLLKWALRPTRRAESDDSKEKLN